MLGQDVPSQRLPLVVLRWGQMHPTPRSVSLITIIWGQTTRLVHFICIWIWRCCKAGEPTSVPWGFHKLVGDSWLFECDLNTVIQLFRRSFWLGLSDSHCRSSSSLHLWNYECTIRVVGFKRVILRGRRLVQCHRAQGFFALANGHQRRAVVEQPKFLQLYLFTLR